MKRSLLLLFLTGSFFVFIFGLTSCSLAEQVAEQDLSNSISSENANEPGSGKWTPPKPANQNQCQALRKTEEQLIVDTVRMMELHTLKVATCYDAKGNFTPEVNKELCSERIQVLETPLRAHAVDAIVGFHAYDDACISEGAPEIKIPDNLLNGNFDPLSVEGDEPLGTDAYYCCLTCVHSLDVEVTFNPVDIELPNS